MNGGFCPPTVNSSACTATCVAVHCTSFPVFTLGVSRMPPNLEGIRVNLIPWPIGLRRHMAAFQSSALVAVLTFMETFMKNTVVDLFAAAVARAAAPMLPGLTGDAVVPAFATRQPDGRSSVLCFRLCVGGPEDARKAAPLAGFKGEFLLDGNGSPDLRLECVLSGTMINGKAFGWDGCPTGALA